MSEDQETSKTPDGSGAVIGAQAEIGPTEDEQSLSAFLPLAQSFLQSYRETSREEAKLLNRKLDLEEKRLDHETAYATQRFKWLAWLGMLIVVGVFGLSVGLVFWKDRVTEGLFVLGSFVGVIVSVFGGIGLEKAKKRHERQE